MKCKIFWGCVAEAQDAFNKWAKGKQLNREVIIQTQVAERITSCEATSPSLIIIVFHPEGTEWDKTEAQAYTKVETISKQRIAEEPIQA